MKPKNCPICGNSVTIFLCYGHFDCPNEKKWDVRCTNDDCYLYDGTGWWFESEKAAVKKWNDSIKQNRMKNFCL